MDATITSAAPSLPGRDILNQFLDELVARNENLLARYNLLIRGYDIALGGLRLAEDNPELLPEIDALINDLHAMSAELDADSERMTQPVSVRDLLRPQLTAGKASACP